MPPTLSEIQRKHNPTMSSCDLPKICVVGNSCMDRTDWMIERLVVIHRTGDRYTIFRIDKLEINAMVGMYKCYVVF